MCASQTIARQLTKPIGVGLRAFASRGVFGAVLVVLTVSPALSQPVAFVDADADGAGDGSSWEDAYTDLQDALAAAADSGGTITEIWAAAGVYTPSDQTEPDDPRTATFQLINSLALYGGFAGGETSLDERDPATNITILTGDLNADDGPDFENNDENTYHVVTGSDTDPTAGLDGFTITAGNADGSSVDGTSQGGGMYNYGGSPTLANCTFCWNSAGNGGGMLNLEANPALINCTFEHNLGDGGGGMANGYSNPTLTNCVFDGNWAMWCGGGGMSNGPECDPVIVNTTFRNNSAILSGGGMRNSGGNPTLLNCTFVGNYAEYPKGRRDSMRSIPRTFTGGGGLNNLGGTPTLVNCAFIDNVSDRYGGGIHSPGSDTVPGPTLINCTFHGNIAGWGGGGMGILAGGATFCGCSFRSNSSGFGGGLFHFGGSSILIGCVFVGNTAEEGGGMYSVVGESILATCAFIGNRATGAGGGGIVNFDGSPTLTNCTLNDNSAAGLGGGMVNYDENGPTVANCILWGNSDAGGSGESGQITSDETSTAVINYTCVQGWTGELGGVGNIGDDPMFLELGYWDDGGTPEDPEDDVWVDGDYRLQAGSPSINTGDPDFVPEPGETDLDGHARVLCGRVDMGPYEFGIGDYACDGMVDLSDFAHGIDCMTGPQGGPYSDDCEVFDFDYDGDVDMRDFAGFQRAFE